jgi:ligand-binding sensor domain-containing protein
LPTHLGEVNTREVAKYVAGHRVLKIYNPNVEGWPMSFPSNLLPEPKGTCWINFGAGVLVLDETTHTVRKVVAANRISRGLEVVGRMYLGKDGYVWFLTHSSVGVMGFTGAMPAETSDERIPRQGYIYYLFADRTRNLWLTAKQGLIMYDGQRFSEPLHPPADLETAYRSLPYGAGAVTPEEGTFRSLIEVGAAMQAADSSIFLVAARAVIRLTQPANTWELLPRPKRMYCCDMLREDGLGRMWLAGTSGEVAVYDRAKASWSEIDLLAHIPSGKRDDFMGAVTLLRGIYEDRMGKMMFATTRGLVTFAERSNLWEAFTSDNSGLPDDYLTSITEGPDGRIWITERSGIVVLAP